MRNSGHHCPQLQLCKGHSSETEGLRGEREKGGRERKREKDFVRLDPAIPEAQDFPVS